MLKECINYSTFKRKAVIFPFRLKKKKSGGKKMLARAYNLTMGKSRNGRTEV
jgi:hypothetical protein